MNSSYATLVAVVAAAVALLLVVVLLARRRGRDSTPSEPLDRAALQAEQQARGAARDGGHGYGADRTYGGGGPF